MKSVSVYVFDTLADWEIGHAMAHINTPLYQKQPGRYRVELVGESLEPATTMGGMELRPQRALADLDARSCAMLILPGGTSWDEGKNTAAVATAARLLGDGVPVAAICGATFGLARAGLLDECEHTSNAAEYLAYSEYNGGDFYRDEPAVTSRGVITAGSTAPVDFATQIFAALDLYTPEVLAAWHGLFSTGEARYFGALMAATQPAR